MPKTTIFGTNGNDFLYGGPGGELIYGFDGNDVLDGGNGNDELRGGAGADWLAGGNGDDLLEGGTQGDYLQGGAGNDTASYATSTAAVHVYLSQGEGYEGDAEGDKLTGIENLVGSNHDDSLGGDGSDNRLEGGAGDDHLQGWDGNDWLLGGADDDWLNGGVGADVLDGGSGSDGASYFFSSAGVSINLTTGTANGGDAAGDTLISIEKLGGSLHDDTLVGNHGNNFLAGFSGTDVLQGNAGADTFAFSKIEKGLAREADRITDFSQAEGDKIDVSDLGTLQGFDHLVCTFIAGNAFSGLAGEVRCEQTGMNTWVSVDKDGDAAADFQILCVGTINLTVNDFIL
jgi:Ca2+-binding RTX toxin-like protein